MIEELKKILNESDNNFDEPYDMQDDEDMPKIQQTRKKVLRLCDINKLKRIRNHRREELAQDAVFIPVLYGPAPADESGGADMGGMPM